jgi:hypothetical protein
MHLRDSLPQAQSHPRQTTNVMLAAATLAVALLALAPTSWAQAKKEATPDPTGSWKWSFTGGNGQTREMTAKLKLDGEKLKGVVLGRNGEETPIEEPKLKGEEISFQVVRERNGQKVTTKYSGKLAGDAIKGKMERERDGQTQSSDWEAKRLVSPAGTWKWSFTRNDGQTIESTMKLKADGEKLTGTVVGGNRPEAAVDEGKFKDGEVSFQVVRERDGNKFVAKYHGKLEGDAIKGKIEVTINGEDRSFDWEAKRARE